jgi:DNA-binding CsgD family transcriptional regulator/PAS domain-containing protein
VHLPDPSTAASQSQALAWLEHDAIPNFADWLKVYALRADHKLEFIAAAHREKNLVKTIFERDRDFPPLLTDTSGVGKVWRSRQAEVLPSIPEVLLPALCRDEAHLEYTQTLGLTASVCVPVQDEKGLFGVIRFAKSTGEFAPNALETAQGYATELLAHLEPPPAPAPEVLERRKRRVEQLAHLRYKELLAATPQPIQVLDRHGRTLEVNRAWEMFWGIGIEDDPSYHTPLFENKQLLETGVLNFFEQALRGVPSDGPETYYDTSLHTAGGNAHWIRSLARPVSGSSDRPREVLISHQALSEPEINLAVIRLRQLGFNVPGQKNGVQDDPLSPRERAVLTLVAEGRSNKEIAKVLGISDNTAKFHITGLFNKLGANSRAMAVSLAVQQGLL